MAPASFRNPQSGTTDTEQVAADNNQEYSPLLGSSTTGEGDSMPTKRSLLAANLVGGPRALATQVSIDL